MRKFLISFIAFMLVAAIAVYVKLPGGAGSTLTGVYAAATLTQTAEAQSAGAETVVTAAAAGVAVADMLAANSDTPAETGDLVWDETTVVPIVLDGDSASADAPGVTVKGSTVTITAAGTYRLSGTLADGQVVVDSEDEQIVRLILDGVDIHSSTSAPLTIQNADKVLIYLAEGSTNNLSDEANYVFPSADSDEPNATLFSAADLTIAGEGALTVTGSYNDGIASKDGLIISSGTITVQAVDDGIRGKDYLVIEGGSIAIEAQGDGLKSDNAEDASKGYILIEGGTLSVNAAGDAIAAETDVLVSDGEITLTSGGGSSASLSADLSAKGIKGVASVVIDGGSLTIDAADDALHSNGSVTINAGAYVIATGDDGIHADATLEINGGNLQIARSYEGIESAVITINGGELHIVSSDDGVNVAGGADGSGMMRGGGPGGMTPGQEVFNYSGDYWLYINGGTIVVNADGDGLDANGAIEMTGGLVVVNGPTNSGNGAMDYDGGFKITGGTLVAAGSAGMAQAPDSSSSQYSILVNFSTTLAAGTLVHIENAAGEEILTFALSKQTQSIAFSSPELLSGETYTVYTGGSATGTQTDGLYGDAVYTPGTQYTNLTLSGVTTSAGAAARGGRRR